MPAYSVRGPDGRTYTLEGPPNASNEMLQFAILQHLSEEKQRTAREAEAQRVRSTPAPAPERTVLGNTAELLKGLIPGAVGLGETAGVGLSALLPEQMEKSARAGIAEIAGVLKAPFAAAPGYEDSVGRKLSEGLGSTLPFFALGPLGLLGRLAGTGIGAAAGAGEARLGAESKGATESERATATALGAPTGLLDMLAPRVPAMKSMVVTALTRGGVEGATEAAQKIAQNLIAKGVYNPSQPILEGSGEEGAYGAGVGALASLIIDITIGRKARRADLERQGLAAPETPPAAPAAAPPATTPGQPVTPGAPIPPRDLGTQAGLEYMYGETGERLTTPEAVNLGTPAPARDTGAEEQRIAEAQDLAQERRRLDRLLSQAQAPQEVQQLQTALAAVDSQLEKFADIPTPEGISLTISPKATISDGVTLYKPENATLYNGGELWTTNKKEAEKQGRVSTVTLPREVVAANAQDGASEGQYLFAGTTPDKLYEAVKAPDPMLRAAVDAVIESGSPSVGTLQDKLNIDFPRASILLSQLEQIGVASPSEGGKPRELLGIAKQTAKKLQTSPTETMLDKRGEAARKQETEARQKTEQAYSDLFDTGTTTPDGRTYPKGPGQPDLPFPIERGGPQPEAETEVEEGEKEAKPFQTVLTPDFLTSIGLPKQSGYFRQLAGMNMADETNRPTLGKIFYNISQNANISQRTKDAVERIKMQAFGGLATQGEMFGPRGGLTKEAKEQEAKGKAYRREQQKAEKAAEKAAAEKKAAEEKAAADEAAKKAADKEARAEKNRQAQKARRKAAAEKKAAEEKAAAEKAAAAAARKAEKQKKKKAKSDVAAREAYYKEQEEKKAKLDEETRQIQQEVRDLEAKVIRAKREKELKETFAAGNTTADGRVYPAEKGQLSLPFERGGPQAEREEAPEPERKLQTKLTASFLTSIGFPENSGYFKKLVGLDMADPKNHKALGEVLLAISKNPRASVLVKEAAERIKMQAFGALATQKDIDETQYDIAYATKGAPGVRIENNHLVAVRLGDDIQIMMKPPYTMGDHPLSAAYYNSITEKLNKLFKDRYGDNPPAKLPKTRPVREAAVAEAEAEVEVETEVAPTNAAERRAAQQAKQEGSTPAPAPEVDKLTGAAVTYDRPLTYNEVTALKAGNLKAALNAMQPRFEGRMRRIVSALGGALAGTKIEVVDGLKDPKGEAVPGYYDRATNTIRLDSKRGMNAHALLHEVTHAVVHKVLSNPSHPMTKQLTALFNTVKPHLDTAYGASSLDEFVSEVFSNKSFQQKLAQVNPKGEAISALRRFFNAVTNTIRRMIGMDPKGLDTALDAADQMIHTLIAPNTGAIAAGDLYQASMLGTLGDVFKQFDDVLLSLPVMNNAIATRIHQIFRMDVPDNTKFAVFSSLNLNSLADVVKNDFPEAIELVRLESNMNGAVDTRMKELEATKTRAQRWIGKDHNKNTLLSNVMHESTSEEVDPSRPRSTYVGKMSKSGIDKGQVWDSLQPSWKALGPEGREIYEQLRDTYAEFRKDLVDILVNRIESTVSDPTQAAKLKQDVIERLVLKGKIEPYFPLWRSGDFWVEYVAKSPAGNMEFYKEAFDTSVERDRAILALKANPNVQNSSVKASKPSQRLGYKDAPPGSFVNTIVATLDKNNVDPEVVDQIVNIYLDTLPETSFAQSYRKRKNIEGYKKDAMEVFSRKSASMAYQIASLTYVPQMYKVRDAMKEHAGSNEIAFKVLNRHIEKIARPDIHWIAKGAVSGTFLYTLGGNVSSALIATAHVPMVVAPYLAGEYGSMKDTTAAIGFATKVFVNSGTKQKVKMSGTNKTETLNAAPSLDNYDFADKNLPDDVKVLEQLKDLAIQQGMLTRTITSDMLSLQDNKNTVLDKVNYYSGFMFQQAERMSRQVSMVAIYRLELERMQKAMGLPDLMRVPVEARREAAQRAIDLAEFLNGSSSSNSAPLISKNSWGKVLTMYKRFGLAMYYTLFRTASDMLTSENPATRRAAKRQIAGIFGMSALLAGVQGVPMFGMFALVYNLFLKGDDDEDAETALRKSMGEGLFSGAVNYFTGTATANRIGLSDLLIQDTNYKEQDGFVQAALSVFGGPVVGVATRIGRGVGQMADGHTERGLEQILPSSIANALKGYRYGTEGATTLRGDPITGEIGPMHAFGQAFGFAPAEYVRQSEENAVLKNIERRVITKRTELMRKYFVAWRAGDYDAALAFEAEMYAMNNKWPGLVTPKSIRESLRRHVETSGKMHYGITLNPLIRRQLLEDVADWDRDDTTFWN